MPAPIREETEVTYHGSVTEWHNARLIAWYCGCAQQECGRTRYELEHPVTGDIVLLHVRPTSIAPA